MTDDHRTYWEGKIDTELCAMKEALERIESTLREHIGDETRRFDTLGKDLAALKLWKASVLGVAAGIAFVFSVIGTWLGGVLRKLP